MFLLIPKLPPSFTMIGQQFVRGDEPIGQSTRRSNMANWRLRNHYDCSIHGFVNRWSKFKESTPYNNVVDTRKQHQRRSLYFVTCNSRCRGNRIRHRRYRLCVKSTTTFWSRLIHYYLKSRSRLHDSRVIIHTEGKNEQECNYRDGYSRESNLVSQSVVCRLIQNGEPVQRKRDREISFPTP